jgi:hypothetical protein
MPTCPQCGGEVEQRHSYGPHPTYCGPLCRKRAERERIKRLYHLGAAVEQATRGLL